MEVECRVEKGEARTVLMLGSEGKALRWLLEVRVTASPPASTEVKALLTNVLHDTAEGAGGS